MVVIMPPSPVVTALRGWKLKQVADAINVPPSTLKRWWYEGSEPLYEDGRALRKLHRSVLGKTQ